MTKDIVGRLAEWIVDYATMSATLGDQVKEVENGLREDFPILESLFPPDGVGLTRYDLTAVFSNTAFGTIYKIEESEGGEWVRHEDAAAALAAKEAEAKHWHECWMAEQDLRDKDRAERDARKAALAPFAEALDEDDFADERLLDRDEIWEHPVAMRITFKHLRDAKRAALSPAQGGE